ncbi:hypothetical protein FQR65_LT12938 [Abscondita terminalis]|nr:hypothetical protein FQR65_LT12938 [Abscondita terminalis]
MISFEDTFFKSANLDEIEKDITNSNIHQKKFTSRRNWAALSLSSQRHSVEEKSCSTELLPSNKDQLSLNSEQDDPFIFLLKNESYDTPKEIVVSDDFSEFCNSTQIVKQLDEDIKREEEKHNLSNDNKRKSLQKKDGLFKQPKFDDLPSVPRPQQNSSVIKLEQSKDEVTDSIKEINLEQQLTQLLKSTQYRVKISQLFENIEHSICHFGRQNESWINNSLVNEDFLLNFTQDNNSCISEIVRKILKDNVNKSICIQSLSNCTLLSNVPVFKELGSFYGLPTQVGELLKKLKGIDELYDWQIECLNLAVKERKNLIYSLPTSGGKTLVAEILILREILCRKRNAIFVLPYVSIVQEKVWSLSSLAVELDFLVEEYAAGKGNYPPKKRRHKNCVYVATTEKALGLVNSLFENDRLEELGLIVVDELHLIGDSQRGPTLEALLTKLMFITDSIQIVGMSATIGNLFDISQFLNAQVYRRNFRPIELIEYVKCGKKIAKVNYVADADYIFEIWRDTDFNASLYSDKLNQIDPDHIGGLVMETIPDGSCLVFCPTKKNCENVAKLLCKVISSNLKEFKCNEKKQLLKALNNDVGTICNILKTSIPFGIAYHHSGLTAEERKLIEEAYRSGILCVICCTSTLAAGVNLPAKRVIIRKPYIAQDFINLSRYKQMIGRAGRAGFGEIGESILLCNQDELSKVKDLLLSPMDETLSKLHEGDCSRLIHLFLSCITLGTANTKSQLKMVVNKTLFSVQQDKLHANVESVVRKVINDLLKSGAVHIDTTSDTNNSLNSSYYTITQKNFGETKRTISVDSRTKFVVSKLGSAAMKGNLNLREARLLYDDLTKAKDSLVLVNCLHLLYLVTPYSLVELVKPDKNQFHYVMTQLGVEERKTANILDITESCMVRMLTNQPIKVDVSENVLNRFYMSLMLYELWNEASVMDVSEKYQVNRGIVQNLMTNAATFATNVVMFCEQLEEFWAFVYLLRGMSQRLAHCCCKELLPLMELPSVKQARAKQLFQAGFKNLQSIAKADPVDLVQTIEFMSRKVANQLIAAAKMLLLEKVENLREEAEDVLDGINNK